MEKTIKASIIGLTNRKRELLDNDYANYQYWMIFGIDNRLLSCFKAAKGHKQETIKYKEYPLPLWSILIKDWFRTRDTKLTRNWIKIPNSRRKGIGLWLALKFHQKLPDKYKLKDSFLIRKNNKYYIHFCIDVKEPKKYNPKTIYGIDLGLKNPVTMVDIKTRETKFLAKELKQVKGKYFYLRRSLGENKNLKLIRKLKNREKNKVNNILHKVSREIVNKASKSKAAVVIGKLKNLKKNKGRKFNRKLSNFSHYRLISYIGYKAKQAGVPVYLVNEAYTSKACSVCGTAGKRTGNWFECSNCNYKDNADRNAAFNIGKRGLSYMLKSGVNAFAQKPLVQPLGKTLAENSFVNSFVNVSSQERLNEEASTINVQNCVSA